MELNMELNMEQMEGWNMGGILRMTVFVRSEDRKGLIVRERGLRLLKDWWPLIQGRGGGGANK